MMKLSFWSTFVLCFFVSSAVEASEWSLVCMYAYINTDHSMQAETAVGYALDQTFNVVEMALKKAQVCTLTSEGSMYIYF